MTLVKRVLIHVLLIFLLFGFTVADEPIKFTKARKEMVKVQLRERDIVDSKVLSAMEKVPRHLFVEDKLRDAAYSDHPLPIGEGQTISQPYIVALMTQVLGLGGGEKVLDIGTGSGYQAAILAQIADEVYSVEIRPNLSKKAGEVLSSLGYTNIRLKVGDGYYGWEEHAPYDGIIVAAAADHIPPPLLAQLKDGGRMAIPVGSPFSVQNLVLIEKKDGKVFTKNVAGVLFVPMVGQVEKGEKL
jgi:protein-L-isoaspartate(D-aspartate) O-methyltransferase